ncbi:WD40/YVTN/BNR-like repeat-containing protein [Granulicella arctica]|uniref:Photosynthesis system II assembly factor Ycf48/Hcf136-like domain-containing protein n=1 Tax=Granulicella arctica TaxID=940613 RepID=A0A7Y9TIZ7_9BACT|nr:hypothetical protein [Granulicella arctica]NYF77772.1 hypothetical protein [Granulicella arctica]
MRLMIALFLLATATLQAQWTLEESHTTASLRGIDNVGGGIVWASGTNGTVLRSEDGGYLWQTCTTPPGAEKLDFRGVQAFDENTAIVMSSGTGDLSRLYKTTDGCQSWKLLFTNPDKDGFWDAIQFSKDRNFGVLLGDPVNNIFVIMLTINGGSKWERQTLKATADIHGEAVFAASNSSLLVPYSGDRFFCTGGSGGPRIISLGAGFTDTGITPRKHLPWETALSAERLKTSTSLPSNGCFALAESQKGSGLIIAVGGDYLKPNDRANTAWTNVFDKTAADAKSMYGFHPAQTPPHGYRSAVVYDAGLKAWITVGPNGTDVSFDDGKDWRALKPSKDDAVDADQGWNALSLPFVVGAKGRIGRLNDNSVIGLRGQ